MVLVLLLRDIHFPKGWEEKSIRARVQKGVLRNSIIWTWQGCYTPVSTVAGLWLPTQGPHRIIARLCYWITVSFYHEVWLPVGSHATNRLFHTVYLWTALIGLSGPKAPIKVERGHGGDPVEVWRPRSGVEYYEGSLCTCMKFSKNY